MKSYNQYKKIIPAFCLVLSVSGISCKKFVEIPPPDTQVITSTVFTNDQSSTSAVVGLYSSMMQTNLFFMNGGMTIYPGMTADEIYNISPNSSLDPFTNNALPSSNNIVQNNFWRWAYGYIYQANACIDGLTKSTGVSAAVKQQLTGEMKFTRALCYFYLANLFGDVPLITGTVYQENDTTARTPSAQVYQQIITDLQDAQNLLSSNYPTPGPVRPNKWAAYALLARVYLYQKNWTKAESTATSVINSGSYSLVTNLNNVFLGNSSEAILQFIPVNPFFNTSEGGAFVPSSGTVKPTYGVTSFLLNAFEATDQRKTNWLKSNTVSGQVYTYPNKFKVRSRVSGAAATEYNMILRLAEQYLIRAEARAQQNNIAGATGAVADINVIRQRAGGITPLPDTLSQAACLAAVAQENRIEFFAEWGHRWFDLKRTGQADAVLGSEKATHWQPTAALYPIPLVEIQRNPFLTQNPGY